MAFDYALLVEPSPSGPLAVSAMRALVTPMKCADKALPDLSRLPGPPFIPPPAPGATPDPRCPFHMAWLPGGSFKLGATGKTVKVEPFCIDRTEVSASDYRFCAELGGDDVNRPGRCSSDVGRTRPYTYGSGKKDEPINGVTWEQARQYCQTHGERLPSEAEWEWAARGGPAGNTYPWGNDPPSNQPCWKGPGNDAPGGDPNGPCPSQSHPADVTPQGVYDMAGNLYEWTATPAGRGERIVRGGTWGEDDWRSMKVSAGFAADASSESFLKGLRCVSSPDFVGR
jgi:formylglycine-generating enzyme required for sulfatase activity